MMKNWKLLLAVAPIVFATPAIAALDDGTVNAFEVAGAGAQSDKVSAPSSDTVTTGVAKGRDRLDSATSTSVLREAEIQKLAPRSIGDILRDIPGIRSEASAGEGNANITIRGLPMASTGAKFIQLQEDGLPVLEFGDIYGVGPDNFLRADLNLSQVEVIRGGSASTFASNSPGGIINFISKTGEVEGGAVAVSAGLDYDEYRADFDYGARLTDSVRFHVGGYYRQGEGPRSTGYDAQKGGQIKVNLTKEFTGGYIRFYGKYLDERTPLYDAAPLTVTGTNDDPEYGVLGSLDARKDAVLSKYALSAGILDRNNNPTRLNLANGQGVKSKAAGLEARFDIAGWTVIERMRYAAMSGEMTAPLSTLVLPAPAIAGLLGAPGGSFSYANGPQGGQAIANPMALNGNGLVTLLSIGYFPLHDLGNLTNDLRASRVWDIGGGSLTTTAGFYASRQSIDRDFFFLTALSEVRGNGDAALLNLSDPTGARVTANGIYSYQFTLGNGAVRRSYDVDYDTNAPFASVNYQIGKVAIGASIRYDFGRANGTIVGSDYSGVVGGTVTRDIDGDGVISPPERRVGSTPPGVGLIDYTYNTFSYSTGVNYRIAEPLAVFARYSRGARANADRILIGSTVDKRDGSLLVPGAAVDPVKQAEVGVKYRTADLTLNLTGFWAKAQDTNLDVNTGNTISRDYKAMGLEFEGGLRVGPFRLTAGATYTDAEIARDRVNPAVEGNVPRHQAKFIFQATPQVTFDRFNVGAVFIGTTGSFAQDTNVLRVPGYMTTNAFVQVRPADRLLVSLNASNLFNTLAITGIDDAALPPYGVVTGRVLNGRTVSSTVRFDF